MEEPIRELTKQLRAGRLTSIAPLLPAFLALQGKPYRLDDHFPFEPFFRFEAPQQLVMKTGRQIGKCVSLAAAHKVRLANGRQVSATELRLGDLVLSLGPDGRFAPQPVTNIWQTGEKPVFLVRTRLGASYEITADHRMLAWDGYRPLRDLRVGDRLAAVRKGGQFGRYKEARSRIILTAYMIGDGSCVAGNLSFTSACGQVLDEAEAYAGPHQDLAVRRRQKPDNAATSLGFSKAGGLAKWLKEDGLWDRHAYEKHVPAWVFELSQRDTALFLSRLWATDGTICPTRNGVEISYCSTSEQLATDVRCLLNKFGIPASVHRRQTSRRDAFIVRVETRTGWTTFFRTFNVPGKPAIPLPDLVSNSNRDTLPIGVNALLYEASRPLHYKHTGSLGGVALRRKPKYPLTRQKFGHYLSHIRQHAGPSRALAALEELASPAVQWDEIVSIEPAGTQTTLDLEVEGEHNFVLDGNVSHNSTCLAAQGVVQAATLPYFTTLCIAPLYEMIRRFSSNYVRPFIDESPIKHMLTSTKTENNVLQRSFVNHSRMMFSFAFLNADRVRGIPASKVQVDEAQDLDPTFLPIILECLSASLGTYGLSQYTFTPKTEEALSEKLWRSSSMAEWVIRCQACNKFSIPSIGQDLDKMIGPWHQDISEARPGVVCARCARPIFPRQGRYVHARPDRRGDIEGYHIPQFIMPMHYSSPKAWRILTRKREGYNNTPTNVFYNEVCGETFSKGAQLITEAELMAAATLNLNTIEEARKILQSYTHRVLAVDWGGGGEEEVSFTTIAGMGLLPGGQIDVFYGFRSLTPHDHVGEARLVLRLLDLLGCSHLVHDYTGAGALRETMIVQSGLPEQRSIPVAYIRAASGPILRFIPATARHPRNYYQVDKSRSLVLACNQIRFKQLQFFRVGENTSHEEQNLLQDFLALVEDKINTRLGSDIYTVIKRPHASDDFAQAVNIGMVALYHMSQQWPQVAHVAEMELPPELASAISPSEPGWD